MLMTHRQMQLEITFHVLKKFSPDGKFITKIGSGYGSRDGQFIDLGHLAIDSNGYVYVSDRANNNIQVFKPIDYIHH
jgi:DNA-binding beta-propeller fold protein YncE